MGRRIRRFAVAQAAFPLLYGLAGFVFAAIGCAIYNLVAGWTGGIEIELAAGSGDG